MQISRVNRSKGEARRAYDRLSHLYDFLASSSETPLMLQGLEMLAVRRGENILEIGSGTGKALIKLTPCVGDAGRVYSIDLSPGMLRQSHDRLLYTGMSAHVSLIEGDGARLPYQGESFNAVFMSFTLELFDTPEIPLVLEECQRVLKPGGRLGVVALLQPEHPGRIVRLYEWCHDQFPAYIDCRPINTHIMLLAKGFELVKREERSMWGLPVELVIAKKR
jgi:demethylmenaquinone methyltransferase/2-methoxy-6-polyprenyl-1,4-benzoquinol methylase